MTRIHLVGALAMAIGFGTICAFSPYQKGPGAGLPGITTKDAFPKGCVSCHIQKSPLGDRRLNKDLKKIKRHPDVTAMVKNVPKDCGMCHKAGPTPAPLKSALHKAHYGKKAASLFVKKFQGSCLNCHALNTKTGAMTTKSGPKNW